MDLKSMIFLGRKLNPLTVFSCHHSTTTDLQQHEVYFSIYIIFGESLEQHNVQMSISRMYLLFLPACLYRDDLDSICFVLNAARQGFFPLMFVQHVTAPICLLGISFTVCTFWEEENPANPLLSGVKQVPELVPSPPWIFTSGRQL